MLGADTQSDPTSPRHQETTTTSEKNIYSLQMNSVFVKFHVNVHHIVTLYTSACHLSGHCNEKGCITTLSILPQSDS